jgi:hypothetical protein
MTDHRSLDRRQALRLVGVAAAVPVLAPTSRALETLGFHPLVPHEQGEVWSPQLLSAAEAETVAALADAIIPTTDTPGARAALVHQYIDWVLGSGDAEEARSFRAGIAAFDGAAQTAHGAGFAALTTEQQTALLGTRAAEFDDTDSFLAAAKRLTIDGYYTSEIGMREELDYQGNAFVGRFDGCTHPEHQNWEPEGDKP